jgi:hypothetical protein
VMDITEIVWNKSVRSNQDTRVQSGSDREGFRLEGSDMDCMYWPNNHRVIWDLFQRQLYNIHRRALILSVSSESPPGFTLLLLLSPRAYSKVFFALVPMNGGCYTSSIYREITCSDAIPYSTVHGPCGSGVMGGITI